MDVWIARDGVEIGAYPQADLWPLAREGQLLPTDHYWHEGMQDWQTLSSLIGSQVWKAAPGAPAVPMPTVAVPPRPLLSPELLARLRQPRTLAIAGACALCLLAGIGIYAVHESHLSDEREKAALRASSVDMGALDLRLRDKAAAELRAKIEKLPARPSATSNVFYSGFRIAMTKTPNVATPWTATIRGAEDIVDPKTNEPAWRSDFTLVTDYQDRQWTFNHYHAASTNLKDGTKTEVNADMSDGTPPLVVSELGLKVTGRPTTPPPIEDIGIH